jgi:serine phosphatase RsbU (regulator of sigma subunit)
MDSSVAGPALLPVLWPQVVGVDLYAGHHPQCRGGDFFDALTVSQHVLFLLTDIAAVQPRAQDVAAEVQSIFRRRAEELFAGPDVNESDALAALAHAFNLALIEAAHEVLSAPTFLGCFNLNHGILTYCNAGNLLALVRAEGSVRALEPSGIALGLFTHTTFEAAVLALHEGDALLVVTKGVTGSKRGGTEFGVQRVTRTLRDTTAASASAICEAVLHEAHGFAHHPWSRFLSIFFQSKGRNEDDLTALAVVRS